MAETPQFARPFRIVGGKAIEVEQDSLEEITDCVETVLVCAVGARAEQPDFGTPDQVFSEGGVDTDAMMLALDKWEPRADALVTDAPDRLDALARHVTVNVRGAANG